jgi:GNAT superfamily N-acetyltransferase
MSRERVGVRVRTVEGRDDLRRFLEVPFGIYRDDPNWIAPLYVERTRHLDRRRNPYFQHAEADFFLAERHGEPVGRISAQLDRLHLERHNDGAGQFGFLEAIDDASVFAALIDAAAAWLRMRGASSMRGPFSLSINDESGLLVDGFDRPPSVMMGHARPYYAARLEALGLTKAKDLIAYDYDATPPLPKLMAAMLDKVSTTGELEIRTLSKRHLDRDLGIIMDIFNDAWADNWGFVPLTQGEIGNLGQTLRALVSEDYVAIASWRGEPAAMAVSLPDINRAIHDLGGRLLPLGWARLAWRLFARPPGAVRIPLMGVRKVHQRSALGSALALAVISRLRDRHLKRGVTRAELSWILEDNLAMRRMIEALGGVAYKTYRVYERAL